MKMLLNPCLRPQQNAFHEDLSSTLQKCESRTWRDLAVVRVLECFPTKSLSRSPRGVSCATPVHANMTRCVRRIQQTCDDGIPVLLLLQQSKIALRLTVLLYLLPLLMLDYHSISNLNSSTN